MTAGSVKQKRPLSWLRLKNRVLSVLRNPYWLIVALSFLLLICLVIVPLFSLLKDTLLIEGTDARRLNGEAGTYSLAYWRYLLTGKMSVSMFYKPLLHSLAVALCATVIAVPLGAVLAYLTVRTDLPLKKLFSFLIVIPYMMPAWCKAQAWLSLFRTGASGTPGLLCWLGVDVPDWVCYGPFPMICVLVLHYYAFTYLLVSGALANLNGEWEEAALLQGANRRQIVTKITLPAVLPALLSGAVLTFSKAIGGYSVAYYLGTPANYYTLSTRLYGCVSTGMKGVGYAISLCVILLSACGILLNNRVIGTRRSYATVNGKGTRGMGVSLGKHKATVLVFLCLFLLVAVCVPLFAQVLESFQITPANGLSRSNFTLFNWIGSEQDSYALVNYEPGLLKNSKFLKACGNTVKLALLGGLLCSALGLVFGYISVRGRGKPYARLLDVLVFIPYLIPAVAFSAVYIAMFIQPQLGGLIPSLYGTFFLILLVSVVKYFPFAGRSGAVTMLQIGSEPEEAAVLMGAGFLRRTVKIILPLAKNGFISGFLLSFISIAKEFDLISLLVNPQTVTLSSLSSDYAAMHVYPMASAASVAMTVLTALCYVLAVKLFKADVTKALQ